MDVTNVNLSLSLSLSFCAFVCCLLLTNANVSSFFLFFLERERERETAGTKSEKNFAGKPTILTAPKFLVIISPSFHMLQLPLLSLSFFLSFF